MTASPATPGPLERGFLVVVSGPGGVGKNTLVNAVRRRMPELLYSISVTTRPPRPGEIHGRDYFFVTTERFARLVEAGELLEWARFGDHLYGTPARYVSEAVCSGRIVLLDIDIQGAQQLRASRRLDAVFVFLLPPSLETLRERLIRRASDDPRAIERRMAMALTEMEAAPDYDYVIVNANVDEASLLLESIIRAEACRPHRLRWPTGARADASRQETRPGR
ncbi:guanylate kinase [Geochorda subterranea]|uniref:Guanylate kinase n=1 Tax=Geochorda subterranea TaxID=3109564 RepID=A0ABZ1BLJ7_9FIRM|nr:guanylate kinase [Limnochorda sp. LNt]WRP13393.1 guanylate kinase [Limnochorda sp. LNt]